MVMRRPDTSIVRRCRICKCLNSDVKFTVIKDSKNGKYYTHNICRPCRIEENHASKLRRRKLKPKHDSEVAMKWRKKNTKKWRAYHNQYQRRRRLFARAEYLLHYQDNA